MKRELFVWELKKLWAFPALWIFIAFCLLLNAIMTEPEYCSYDEVKDVRYVYRAVELLYENQDRLDISGGDIQALLDLLPEGDGKEELAWELTEFAKRLKQEEADVAFSKMMKLFALGDASNTVRGMLFQGLCSFLILEGMLISALMALHLYGLEYAERTAATVYATGIGREVEVVKLAAGALSALLTYLVMTGASISFFCYKWKVPLYFRSDMSSPFHSYDIMGMGRLPYRTWVDFSVTEYLLAILLVGAFLVLLFHFLGCVAGLATGNTYRGFLLLAMLMLANTVCFDMAANGKHWMLCQLLVWTPMALWRMIAGWFTDMGVIGTVPWQECATVLACFLLGISVFVILYQCYEEKDI